VSTNNNKWEAELLKIISDTQSIFNNIEWNLGGLIAAAVLIRNPKLLYLNNIPVVIEVDGLKLDGFQALGISLLGKDRKARADELLGAAKRALLCEALEIGADSLVRAIRLVQTGVDPYSSDNYFSANIKELWNSNKGKAGSLINDQDRLFIEKCAAPLRNIIRHNNGAIPPKKEIIYSGKPKNKQINLSILENS